MWLSSTGFGVRVPDGAHFLLVIALRSDLREYSGRLLRRDHPHHRVVGRSSGPELSSAIVFGQRLLRRTNGDVLVLAGRPGRRPDQRAAGTEGDRTRCSSSRWRPTRRPAPRPFGDLGASAVARVVRGRHRDPARVCRADVSRRRRPLPPAGPPSTTSLHRSDATPRRHLSRRTAMSADHWTEGGGTRPTRRPEPALKCYRSSCWSGEVVACPRPRVARCAWRSSDRCGCGGDGRSSTPARGSRPICSPCSSPEGRPISIGELVELIWGDDAPDSALNVIHKYVGTLRRCWSRNPARGTGSYLLRRGNGYLFAAGPGTLDLARVPAPRRPRAGGLADSAEAALDHYVTALELWRGGPATAWPCGTGRDVDLRGAERASSTTPACRRPTSR